MHAPSASKLRLLDWTFSNIWYPSVAIIHIIAYTLFIHENGRSIAWLSVSAISGLVSKPKLRTYKVNNVQNMHLVNTNVPSGRELDTNRTTTMHVSRHSCVERSKIKCLRWPRTSPTNPGPVSLSWFFLLLSCIAHVLTFESDRSHSPII